MKINLRGCLQENPYHLVQTAQVFVEILAKNSGSMLYNLQTNASVGTVYIIWSRGLRVNATFLALAIPPKFVVLVGDKTFMKCPLQFLVSKVARVNK